MSEDAAAAKAAKMELEKTVLEKAKAFVSEHKLQKWGAEEHLAFCLLLLREREIDVKARAAIAELGQIQGLFCNASQFHGFLKANGALGSANAESLLSKYLS